MDHVPQPVPDGGRTDLAGQFRLHPLEVAPTALEQDADQADRIVAAGDLPLDLARRLRVPGLDDDLAYGTHGSEEDRPLQPAGRDADHRPELGQPLDDVA